MYFFFTSGVYQTRNLSSLVNIFTKVQRCNYSPNLVTSVQQGARKDNPPMGPRTKGDPDMMNPEVSSIKSFNYLASPLDTFSLELKGFNQETKLILNSYNEDRSFSTIGLFLCESPDQATLSVGVTRRLSGKHPKSFCVHWEKENTREEWSQKDRSRFNICQVELPEGGKNQNGKQRWRENVLELKTLVFGLQHPLEIILSPSLSPPSLVKFLFSKNKEERNE